MKCRIKKGAMVGQEFSQFEWGDDQTVFTASGSITNGRRKCIGNGHGELNPGKQYGSGAVYVKDCDLVSVDKAIVSSPDPHELWAAAQLMPGEGIEDGVKRIEELLGSNVEMAERAWESYNKLKAEGKIPADLDSGTTSSGAKVRHRMGQQWREYER